MYCYLLQLCLTARFVLAGTYGTENIDNVRVSSKVDENYPSYFKEYKAIPQKAQTIYTRTIVRPASYSYVSASIHPISKEMLYKSEYPVSNSGKNEEPSDQKLNSNIILRQIAVLPGNEIDWRQEDIVLEKNRDTSEETLERPYLENHYEQSVTKIPSIAKHLVGKNNGDHVNGINKQHQNHNGKKFPNKGTRTRGLSSNKHGAKTYKVRQPVKNLPGTILQPPKIQKTNQPNQTQPIFNQFGEYRNQNTEIVRESTIPESSDHKRSHVIREKLAPRQVHEVQEDNLTRARQNPDSSTEITDTKVLETEGQAGTEVLEKYENENVPEQYAQNKKKESSSGSEYKEHHDGQKTEEGKKSYKKENKHEKAEKGHHKKERHKGEYDEEKGEEKKHHKGEGFYGEHHKGEKGKKEKKYGEGKKHKKGHSTHGVHNIVKKDEYIKETKFYDEDHDGGEEEEHGEFHGESDVKAGGKKDGSNAAKGFYKKGTSKKGHHDKGQHDEEHSGFEHDEGHSEHHGHEEEHEDKKGKKISQKWEKH